MKGTVRPIEYYTEKIVGQLRKNHPSRRFEVHRTTKEEAVVYFSVNSLQDNWYKVIRDASDIAVDALVDASYEIHILPEGTPTPRQTLAPYSRRPRPR
jgi:hypothetical protein